MRDASATPGLGLPVRRPRSALLRWRQRLGSKLVEVFVTNLARAGRLHPARRSPARVNVEIIEDVAYRDTGLPTHTLDVYRPTQGQTPHPVALYVHGGGFRILSKESHWMMGLLFARRGYLAFNINYRGSKDACFPTALEDTGSALLWILENARQYGGDPSRIVLAGESAGANLVTATSLALCFERPEPYARRLFESGLVPRAVVGASGLYQVTEEERFFAAQDLSWFIRDRLVAVGENYVPLAMRERHGDSQGELHGELHGEHHRDYPRDRRALDLANPLLLLERDEAPARPLPPFFLSAGEKDPIVQDTRRLEAALRRRHVPCEAAYYDGEPHAFQALWFRRAAKDVWRRTFAFLEPLVKTSSSAPL